MENRGPEETEGSAAQMAKAESAGQTAGAEKQPSCSLLHAPRTSAAAAATATAGAAAVNGLQLVEGIITVSGSPSEHDVLVVCPSAKVQDVH